MAWTAASGGAHGRRRGMAYGRFSAWWAVAALAGGLDRWPFDPDELGAAAAALRWYRWEPGSPEGGWSLRLAAEDPATGTAWAVEARDQRLSCLSPGYLSWPRTAPPGYWALWMLT